MLRPGRPLSYDQLLQLTRILTGVGEFTSKLERVAANRANKATNPRAPRLTSDQAAVLDATTAAGEFVAWLGLTGNELLLFTDPAAALWDAGQGSQPPLLTFHPTGRAATLLQIHLWAWTGAASLALCRDGVAAGVADQQVADCLAWFDHCEPVAQRWEGRPTRWSVRDARLRLEANDLADPVVVFANGIPVPPGLDTPASAAWFMAQLGEGGGAFTAP